ncbi:MAG TPA: TlpA disulfide reductase family protein [Myxococcaceae bacterium]
MEPAPTPEAQSGLRATWRRARQRRWVRWGMDLVLMAVVLLGVMAWQTRYLPGAGTPAPDFNLPTLTGEQVSLASLSGKPVVLVFWAPWCKVCKSETSTISAVRDMVGERAHVLSVAVSYRREEDVRRFARQQKVDYPVLLGNDELEEAFGVRAFPTTFVLSADGRIQQTSVGSTTRLGFLWRLWRSS